jgi:uncharacterized membrane protein
MLPDPIHPAIVHFPIVLAVLLPLVALGAFLLARRGTPIRTAWTGVAVTAALLTGSAWLALETGEEQEERVEKIVSEGALETHQDRATLFLYLSATALLLSAAGLARGRAGQVGRAAATITALALLPTGYLVGHSGGELVYKYGAAQAYTSGPAQPGMPSQDGKQAVKDEDER